MTQQSLKSVLKRALWEKLLLEAKLKCAEAVEGEEVYRICREILEQIELPEALLEMVLEIFPEQIEVFKLSPANGFITLGELALECLIERMVVAIRPEFAPESISSD